MPKERKSTSFRNHEETRGYRKRPTPRYFFSAQARGVDNRCEPNSRLEAQRRCTRFGCSVARGSLRNNRGIGVDLKPFPSLRESSQQQVGTTALATLSVAEPTCLASPIRSPSISAFFSLDPCDALSLDFPTVMLCGPFFMTSSSSAKQQ